MICCSCGKEIDINYGREYWNGIYCKKCADEMLSTPEYIKNYKRIIADLQAENAPLRERLGKAVEIPCKVGDKVYEIIEGEVQGERVENYRIDNMGIWVTVQLKFGTSTILLNEARKIFLTREAAEARLKELGGRR